MHNWLGLKEQILLCAKTDDTGLRNYAIITRAVKGADFSTILQKDYICEKLTTPDCGTMLLLIEQLKEQIFYRFSKRLHLWKYHCHFDFIIFLFCFLSLERVGSLSAASSTVPPMAACSGRSPATARLLCAADPSRFHYRNLLRPGCGAWNNTVHSPSNGGGLALSGQASLGLQDTVDVLVGGGC